MTDWKKGQMHNWGIPWMCSAPRWSVWPRAAENSRGRPRKGRDCQREAHPAMKWGLEPWWWRSLQATGNDFACSLGSPALVCSGCLLYVPLHWSSLLAVPVAVVSSYSGHMPGRLLLIYNFLVPGSSQVQQMLLLPLLLNKVGSKERKKFVNIVFVLELK